jgi:molybdate transport system permease protein
MDGAALQLSLKLAAATALLLVPLALMLVRALARRPLAARGLVDGLVALPLVLPPTVLGFYLLTAFGGQSTLGQWYAALTGRQLVFTFDGLLLASLIANIPFAVQPIQRAFAAIPREACEAAWCSGLSNWQTLWKIELPLAWPGILAALVLTFTHTLGEFGVVLMVGGNIASETRTVSIAIYDSVQSFNDRSAHVMSAILVLLSVAGIALIHWATQHIGRKDA